MLPPPSSQRSRVGMGGPLPLPLILRGSLPTLDPLSQSMNHNSSQHPPMDQRRWCWPGTWTP